MTWRVSPLYLVVSWVHYSLYSLLLPYQYWSSNSNLIKVLDPQISYRGLITDCGDNLSAKGDIDFAKEKLETCYQSHYHWAPQSLPTTSQPQLSVTTSQLTTSLQKVNFTSRFKQHTPATWNELKDYFKLPQEDFEACDPLKWWAGRVAQFLNLSKFARDFFGAPGMFFVTEIPYICW